MCGVCVRASDASCRALGVADNDAVLQRVERVLRAKLRKKLHGCGIRPAHVRLGRVRVKVAPARAAGVDDGGRLGHLDADVRAVCATATVPCLYSPRQCLIHSAVALDKSMDADTLPVGSILIKILRHDGCIRLRAPNAM